MEFRILGPFEVSERGQPLEVGAGKQRALLALLLLRAGEVVSTDRLIDALWDEDPPASAINSVHIYVSQLRKALGNGRLETRGHGYLLTLEPEQLDLGRFERLLSEGRELLAAGEAERAAEALGAAVALWRGPPLSDFTSEPFAQGEIARLEELHLSALEERIEADLALGRHAELVPELEALVREQPLRERLRAELMLALYRSGRQADALDAYRQTRRMLAEELGLEPGRRLQELESAILKQDAQLDLPHQAASPIAEAAQVALTPPWYRRRRTLAAGGALLLAAVVTAVLLRGGGSSSATVPPNSVAVIDPETNEVVDDFEVGVEPDALAVGEGVLWVANLADETLSKVNAASRRVEATIPVDARPTDVDVAGREAWVADGRYEVVMERLREDSTVVHGVRRVRPPRDVAAFSIRSKTFPGDPFQPAGISVGEGAIWVAYGDSTVARLDPTTGAVTLLDYVGLEPAAVSAAAGGVWVANRGDNTVMRINPLTRTVVQTVTVGGEPSGIAAGRGSIWVSASKDDAVSRIPASPIGSSSTSIRVGDGPTDVATGEGFVWVANGGDGTVSKIEPDSGEVVATIVVGNRPAGVAVGAGFVWVTVQVSDS